MSKVRVASLSKGDPVSPILPRKILRDLLIDIALMPM